MISCQKQLLVLVVATPHHYFYLKFLITYIIFPF